MSSDGQPPRGIRYAQLGRDDLARIGDIDRTERIDTLYVQRGTELVELSGDFSARPWGTTGGGEHSVAGLAIVRRLPLSRAFRGLGPELSR